MKRFQSVMVSVVVGCSTAAAFAAAPNYLPIPPSVLREVEQGKPASVPAAKQTEERIAALKDKALGTDATVAMDAIHELKVLGNVARPTLFSVLRTVLTRDQDAVRAAVAGIGDGAEAADFGAKIETLRAEARANVPLLDKSKPETIKKAHAFYDQLVPMTAKMNQAWALRMAIVDAMSRRGELVRIWREVGPTSEKLFTVDAETKLKESATAAVGDFVERVGTLQWGKPPTDPQLKPLWFFGMCRKVEAWNNAHLDKFMDAEEVKNLAAVNTYREAIGLMPYEADPRLVQAARRHSKEMVDLKYFSHESPTESEKSFGMRAKNAGYAGAAGENIAYGAGTGEKTFWMWFDSPGHHKNMAGGSNHLGVGRWNGHYTQVFGGAPRLMTMRAEEREKVKIEGKVLEMEAVASKK